MTVVQPEQPTIHPYFVGDPTLVAVSEFLATLPADIGRSAQFLILHQAMPLLRLLHSCESPIEMRMALVLPNALQRRFPAPACTHVEGQWSFADWMRLQGKYWAGPGYRCDFLCSVWSGTDCLARLAVECDGHDFHERSPEQVRSDHKRDQDLRLEGVETMRLSGSEIHRNPLGCGAAVADRLAVMAKEGE